MKKITKISFENPFKLNCLFNNGENRVLDLEKVLDKTQKYSKKIFEGDTFSNAKIGSFGEIYWENLAEIKKLNGEIVSCEYDISPEFAYLKSEPINK